MEELRERLIKSILEKGRQAIETVIISQQLDIYIVEDMRKKGKC